MKRILIPVDVQDDFISGALAVPDAGEIVPIIARFLGQFDAVVYTQDWHPTNHCSFEENGGPWPRHCVMASAGSMINIALPMLLGGTQFHTVKKGMSSDVDSYSAFWDNERENATRMMEMLTELGATRDTEIYICGLASEFCVKFTVLDALEEFDNVFVIDEACRGVDKEAANLAFDEMDAAGAEFVTLREANAVSFD